MLTVPLDQELSLTLALMLTAVADPGAPLTGNEEVSLVVAAGGALSPISRLLFAVNTSVVPPRVTLGSIGEFAPEGSMATFQIEAESCSPFASYHPVSIEWRGHHGSGEWSIDGFGYC